MKRCCTRWNDRQKAGKRILCLLMACLLLTGCQGTRKEEEKNSIRIGISLYRGDDTFINNIRNELEEQAKEYERENGIKVTLDIQDAKGSQNTQNNQVERFISLGCDVLCINPVDRMDASVIIDKAMTAGVPVVFFNREPVEEDMNRWDQLYYIGVDAKETAVLGEQSSGFPDPYRVVGSDAEGRRRSDRKDHGRYCELGTQSGVGADGAVAWRISGNHRTGGE